MTPKRTLKRYASLKAWRDARELSQRQAARELGMSQGGYAKLELGLRHPRGEVLKRLVADTGVPIEVLTGIAS